jgi:hypothetical protein
MKSRFMFIVMIIVLALSACTSASVEEDLASDQADAVVQEVAVEPTQTNTPEPTEAPTLEPTATPTATPEPTVTPEPTPIPPFEQAQLDGLEERGDQFFFFFRVEEIEDEFAVKINDLDYDCHLEPDYPGRLFCAGPRFSTRKGDLSVTFAPIEDPDNVIYQGMYAVPAVAEAPMPAGDPSTWCPERGQNVFCETEYRIDINGNPCIVQSCFDACGYYYSNHTCPKPWTGGEFVAPPG